jgi:hypothetical protein
MEWLRVPLSNITAAIAQIEDKSLANPRVFVCEQLPNADQGNPLMACATAMKENVLDPQRTAMMDILTVCNPIRFLLLQEAAGISQVVWQFIGQYNHEDLQAKPLPALAKTPQGKGFDVGEALQLLDVLSLHEGRTSIAPNTSIIYLIRAFSHYLINPATPSNASWSTRVSSDINHLATTFKRLKFFHFPPALGETIETACDQSPLYFSELYLNLKAVFWIHITSTQRITSVAHTHGPF